MIKIKKITFIILIIILSNLIGCNKVLITNFKNKHYILAFTNTKIKKYNKRIVFIFENFNNIPVNILNKFIDLLFDYINKKQFTKVSIINKNDLVYKIKGELSITGGKFNSTIFYNFIIKNNNQKIYKKIAGFKYSTGILGDPWQGINKKILSLIIYQIINVINVV